MINTTKMIASLLLIGFTAFTLMLTSQPKEVNAHGQIIGNGGTTGWNPVNSTSETSCLQKGIERMNILVDQGDIQTLPNGNSWRFRKGNNVIFSVFCTKSGDHVRVDVICFNACERDIFRLRETIDALMQW